MSQEEVRSNPLGSIGLRFSGTKTHSALLRAHLSQLTHARTVGDLHDRLAAALNKLTRLDAFKTTATTIYPGSGVNTAVVHFDIKDLRWWEMSLGFNTDNEGGRSVVSGIVRNVLGRAEQTRVQTEFKHNTGTWGYELSHVDKLFSPKHYSVSYSAKKASDELDQNVIENSYGGSVSLETFDGVHRVTLGRKVRTNAIAVEYASLALLREELATTAKNSLTHTYTLDTRDNSEQPTTGRQTTVTNEVALGHDASFHKVEGRVSQYFPLFPDIPLQVSGYLGFFTPWAFTKTNINDRFRGRYLKGFRSVGDRVPPANPEQVGKYLVEGDDLGKLSQMSLEAKLHFYNMPFLQRAGLIPFIYGNLIVVDPLHTKSAAHFQQQTRGSLGFGLGWNMAFGRIEFTYASRVFSKPGDVPAEFQILFAH
jgi:outer membrane protein assembly factor BamA